MKKREETEILIVSDIESKRCDNFLTFLSSFPITISPKLLNTYSHNHGPLASVYQGLSVCKRLYSFDIFFCKMMDL